MPRLRIALISDPHFYTSTPNQGGTAYSHLPVDNKGEILEERRGPRQNPWADLQDLIRTEQLSADLLLCAGDITSRSDDLALRAGWRMITDLGQALGAGRVAAATGNHDVNSRSGRAKAQADFRNLSLSFGLVEPLKLLTPSYPVHELRPHDAGLARAKKAKYFGESFLMLDDDPRYRLLIVNTCSEHGHDDFEYERGVLPESTLALIKEDLAQVNDNRVNVLVLHHPLGSTSQDGNAVDFLQRGDQLIQALDAKGAWLMCHGHKHYSQIMSAPSLTGRRSAILSLASLAAQTNPPLNQFYLIEAETDSDGRLRGVVHTWDWHVGQPWRRAIPHADHRVFDQCGFGSRLDHIDLAQQIAAQAESGVRRWADLLAAVPELRYSLPAALASARELLQSKYGWAVDTDDDGRPVGLARAMT